MRNPTQSDLERMVVKWITRNGLPLPVLQHEVRTELCLYHFDFAYPQAMLGIEAGGFTFHGDRTAYDNDARRNSALVSQGWRILPVTTTTKEVDFVRDVRAALRYTGVKSVS